VPAKRKRAPGGSVIGYIRVSTTDQVESGLGLDAQRATLIEECDRRGYTLLDVCADKGVSAKSIEARRGLIAALTRVEAGEAHILMVSKLDRLSRSLHDFTGLLHRAEQGGWALVACDLGVDTNTPAGEAMAHMLATFAQFERRLIGQRTSEALQAKLRAGAVLGRPDRASPEIVARIVELREAGESLRKIAARLNADQVPTSQGGDFWYASTVASVLSWTRGKPPAVVE
jgi:DNA invertase Pin-like site-specific DNA recombinase